MVQKLMRTCIRPDGSFIYGLHTPSYTVANRRPHTEPQLLGTTEKGQAVFNSINLLGEDVFVEGADWIFEITNPFPFKGVTYINKKWADNSAHNPEKFHISQPAPFSLSETLRQKGLAADLIAVLPSPLRLALAVSSTDPNDLIELARLSCEILLDESITPIGLVYQEKQLGSQPIIHDLELFEAVANNPALPDAYRVAMVIRPGAQGNSPITAEWQTQKSHAYEYLRANSYIAGGHYAANMAEDAIRYAIKDLEKEDIIALRHLYYQRSYLRMAEELGISVPNNKTTLTPEELETLRTDINSTLKENQNIQLISKSTLWGWNFGFDYAPTGYRLHASHQQVHQQYAIIPKTIQSQTSTQTSSNQEFSSFSCGDLIAEAIAHYRQDYNSDYFLDYIRAIENNTRMDNRDELEDDLIVWSDTNVMLFVPKAQTSQWELQLISRPDTQNVFIGNLLEADTETRNSFDLGILLAQKALAGLGARLVTSIEYSKEFGEAELNQPLIYVFLPRLPGSPGTFSEAQSRYISGHYPEDFAKACRKSLVEADVGF